MESLRAAISLWLDRDLTRCREFQAMILSLIAYPEKNKKDFRKTVTPEVSFAFIQIT
jgi:hypothetical protein